MDFPVTRFMFAAIRPQRFTGVRVHGEAREIAAGDVQPDAVAFFEDVRRVEGSDAQPIHLTRLQGQHTERREGAAVCHLSVNHRSIPG